MSIDKKNKVKEYYDQRADTYVNQYCDGYEKYPSNLIRINFIIERLKKNNVKTILDAGCGTCGAMIKLLDEGYDVKGFDFSDEMVKEGKVELKKFGYDPELIHFADLEDHTICPDEMFDVIIAVGVFPHILNEKKALANIRRLLKPNGLVFVEFRNDLFSAYSLNKYSLEFFLNRVVDIDSFPEDSRENVIDFYSSMFKVDKPIKNEDGKLMYTDILAKYHNPLTIKNELFVPNNFSLEEIHFYHYHALPPVFEKKDPKLFRELSLKLENPNDWRGYLMASAYVIEARRID